MKNLNQKIIQYTTTITDTLTFRIILRPSVELFMGKYMDY